MNKKSKFIILLFAIILTVTGCTKSLKNSDNKPVVDEVTGKTITENILCKPTDERIVGIYEDNGKDLSKLPECSDMKVTGKYEGLWDNLFVRPLAYLIIKVGSLFNSTAISIIVVTLIIRICLYPVTKKTAMQSENIKKAQPEIDRIEKKYKDKTDSESLSKKGQETLLVYQKYNINPLSGCLFSFIQIPLLFGFLEAINRVPAIFEETIFGLQMGTTPSVAISNGNYYYLLIILLIIGTTYLSFKMNKSTASSSELQSQTKTMTLIMVAFIGFMSFSLPTAIALYWITGSAFTIFQNIITDRSRNDA